MAEYYITVDYHIVEPFRATVWKYDDGRYSPFDGFYFDSRIAGFQMTDEEYYKEIEKLAHKVLGETNHLIEAVLIHPSAASFIETCRKHNFFNIYKKFPDGDIDQIEAYREKALL